MRPSKMNKLPVVGKYISKSTKESEKTRSPAQEEQAHKESGPAYSRDVESVLIIVNLSPDLDRLERIVGENYIVQSFAYQRTAQRERHIQIQIEPVTIPGDHQRRLDAQLTTRLHDGTRTQAELHSISLQVKRTFKTRDVLALYRHYHLDEYRFHSQGSENESQWHIGSKYWNVLAVRLLEENGYVVAGSAIEVYQMLAKHCSEKTFFEQVESTSTAFEHTHLFSNIKMGTFHRPETQAQAFRLLDDIHSQLSDQQTGRGPRLSQVKRLLIYGADPNDTERELQAIQALYSDVGPRWEGLDRVYVRLVGEQALTAIHICCIEEMLGYDRSLTAAREPATGMDPSNNRNDMATQAFNRLELSGDRSPVEADGSSTIAPPQQGQGWQLPVYRPHDNHEQAYPEQGQAHFTGVFQQQDFGPQGQESEAHSHIQQQDYEYQGQGQGQVGQAHSYDQQVYQAQEYQAQGSVSSDYHEAQARQDTDRQGSTRQRSNRHGSSRRVSSHQDQATEGPSQPGEQERRRRR